MYLPCKYLLAKIWLLNKLNFLISKLILECGKFLMHRPFPEQ